MLGMSLFRRFRLTNSSRMNGVSLIPFVVGLIGFDQCVKESPELWKFGPEYTFRFQVLGSVLNEPNRELSSNISSIVKCRLFSSKSDRIEDALRCSMTSAQIDNYETDKSSKPPIVTRSEPPGPFDITGFTFDVIFGKTKIDEIRTHHKFGSYRLNMYRDIVSQLNLAFNGIDEKKERFAARGYEGSTIGECDTKFEVSKQIKFPGRMPWHSKCQKMHLEVYGANFPSVMIEKTRNMKNCTKSTPYFFGGEDSTPYVVTETNTSVSGFLIAPQSFESHTIRAGFMNITKSGRMKKLAINEEIDLYLVSIEPATTEFKPMATYGVTKIFANDPIILSNDKI